MNSETPRQEQKEQPLCRSSMLTKEELQQRIYQGDSLPQDQRFLSPEKGGVFKYFDLHYLISDPSKKELVYPVVEVDNEIVALAELEKSPHQGEDNIY